MKKFSLVVALFAHLYPVNVVFVSELGSVTGAHRDSSITLLMKLFDQRQMPVVEKRSVGVSCVSNDTLNSSVRG